MAVTLQQALTIGSQVYSGHVVTQAARKNIGFCSQITRLLGNLGIKFEEPSFNQISHKATMILWLWSAQRQIEVIASHHPEYATPAYCMKAAFAFGLLMNTFLVLGNAVVYTRRETLSRTEKQYQNKFVEWSQEANLVNRALAVTSSVISVLDYKNNPVAAAATAASYCSEYIPPLIGDVAFTSAKVARLFLTTSNTERAFIGSWLAAEGLLRLCNLNIPFDALQYNSL